MMDWYILMLKKSCIFAMIDVKKSVMKKTQMQKAEDYLIKAKEVLNNTAVFY